MCQASKSGNALVKEERGDPVWLQRIWGMRTELARGVTDLEKATVVWSLGK